MGVQYASQVPEAIVHNLAIFKSTLYDTYTQSVVEKDMQVWDYYLKQYDPKFEDWLDGLQEGLKQKGYSVTHGELLMIMYYPSELWCRPSSAYPTETGVKALSVSVPAANASGVPLLQQLGCHWGDDRGWKSDPCPGPDGRSRDVRPGHSPRLSDRRRQLGVPDLRWEGERQRRDETARAFAWSMTAIPTMNSVWGLGEGYFHYLAQYANSPAEAVEYLKATPRGSACGGFLFSDATTIRAFETHADRYHERVSGDEGETGNYMVQTNHLVDSSLSDINFPAGFGDIGGTQARYDTVFEFLKEANAGAVDWKWIQGVWASDDWYDKANAVWHRNTQGTGNTSNDHTSNASFVFQPKDLVALPRDGNSQRRGCSGLRQR